MNFYSVMSKAYDLLDVLYFSEKGKNPREVINEMISREPMHVLDLCCGTLSNSISIAKKNPDSKILGIDLSKEMLQVARKKVRKMHLNNIFLKCTDATRTKMKSNSFDIVVIGLVLHECSPELVSGILQEAHRLVKDSGSVIILEWEKPNKLLQIIKYIPLYIGEVVNSKDFLNFYHADKKVLFETFGFKLKQVEHCNYTAVYRLLKNKWA